jgi:hypothetical protein
MKRMVPILCLCLVVGLCACGHKNKNAALISSQIDSTFQQTIALLSNSNEKLLKELQKKRYDPCTQIEGEQGLYFSDKLQKVSNVLLERVKEMEDGLHKPSVSVDDFFEEQGKANELQASLKTYKHSLLKIDTIITDEFADIINKLPESIITKGIDLDGAFIQLSNIRTQVYLMQNKIMQYFVMRTCVLCCGSGEWSEFLVNQSSSIVFAGGKLKITAGIATYQPRAMPLVSINNKPIEVQSGKAVHQIKVSDIPGEYDVPVTIQYKDQKTGALKTQTRKVHYTVIKKEE